MINEKGKKGICGVLVCLVMLWLMTANVLAVETRGLRITAKDTVSGEQKEVQIYNKSYAVIIGIDKYANLPPDRQLTYAVRDAKGVAAALQKNFKFDKIITLYDKDATKDRQNRNG